MTTRSTKYDVSRYMCLGSIFSYFRMLRTPRVLALPCLGVPVLLRPCVPVLPVLPWCIPVPLSRPARSRVWGCCPVFLCNPCSRGWRVFSRSLGFCLCYPFCSSVPVYPCGSVPLACLRPVSPCSSVSRVSAFLRPYVSYNPMVAWPLGAP